MTWLSQKDKLEKAQERVKAATAEEKKQKFLATMAKGKMQAKIAGKKPKPRCPICASDRRIEIEADMVNVGQATTENVKKWNLSFETYARHKREHLPVDLQEAVMTVPQMELAVRLAHLSQPTREILQWGLGMDEMGGKKVALAALAELRAQYDMEARLTGKYMKERPNDEAEKRREEMIQRAVGEAVKQAKEQGWDPAETVKALAAQVPEVAKWLEAGGTIQEAPAETVN